MDAASSMRASVKSLLLVACTTLLLALGTAAPAAAAGVPCWQAVINDWYDGQIDHKYSPACYTAALHHLPRDVKDYSSAKDDIERARLAAIRQGRGGGGPPRYTLSTPPKTPPKTSAKSNRNETGNETSNGNRTASSEQSPNGAVTRAFDWLGPSNAASVPLPLLILAGVAFLLLAAAGSSFVSRRLHERRLPPPQA
jgi:hypothetical protein